MKYGFYFLKTMLRILCLCKLDALVCHNMRSSELVNSSIFFPSDKCRSVKDDEGVS